MRVLLWDPLGGPLCRPMTLLSSLNHSRNVSGGSWLGKKQWRRKDRVNTGKTKIMICGMGLNLLWISGESPCTVCYTGVGSNSIFCNSYKHWVHKKYNGFKRLTEDSDYRCTWCQGTACPLLTAVSSVAAPFWWLRDHCVYLSRVLSWLIDAFIIKFSTATLKIFVEIIWSHYYFNIHVLKSKIIILLRTCVVCNTSGNCRVKFYK